MGDWSLREWISTVAGVATVLSFVFAVWWSLRSRERGPKASSASEGNARSVEVADCADTAMVVDSSGATVVRGDMHVRGYAVEDHERLVNERVAQTRSDLERAHQAELESLRVRIAALSAQRWNPESVRAIGDALSANDFERADRLLTETEDRHPEGHVGAGVGGVGADPQYADGGCRVEWEGGEGKRAHRGRRGGGRVGGEAVAERTGQSMGVERGRDGDQCPHRPYVRGVTLAPPDWRCTWW